jgi:hypothetical protein
MHDELIVHREGDRSSAARDAPELEPAADLKVQLGAEAHLPGHVRHKDLATAGKT